MLLRSFFAFLAPYDCMLCGREGELLCSDCLATSCPPLPEQCFRCQALTVDSAVCAACRKHTVLKHVWVGANYDGAIRDVLHAYKYARAGDCAKLLARLLDAVVPLTPPERLVTYVPTASSRVRQRGYDHAKLLARAWAKSRRLQAYSLLLRHGQLRQVGASRIERQRQMEGVFQVRTKVSVQNKHILLIDDVVTTGATLDAAARALKAAGAANVDAAVVARKR